MTFVTNDKFYKNNQKNQNKKKNDIFLIKSYVVRGRCIGQKKKEYILKYWKIYGIDFNKSTILDYSSFFSNDQPYVIDVGFGDGKLLVEKAMNYPHINFIGVEVYPKSIFTAIQYANIFQVSNIRIIFHDIVEVLFYMIPNRTISMIQIFFPDPWFKNKHHKRRLINDFFITLIEKKIVFNGFVHIVTDCLLYSTKIFSLMSNNSNFKFLSENNIIFPFFSMYLQTKFEKRARLLNNSIFDYKYKLQS
ncbi:tRNA (guanine-N(7)-)-methyltransferase [Buchnera aphidicola (Cinara pseudotaxifoliae)]|uniref:tRNA (guanine-N(7)-)-methyltransferase n=1 Tax=Buchnera aphidicola (Cinara pseudotaxifoliae) TaxID=655384 RepID=A0A451DHW4_9GAMM|nr:tRNA (guanosine(46)-N7)-methyltransferase TrmB [Buchnera aphidicola]VFP86239.1 tRNA (guanine-N(7)-)-methyltransferase [Buchnera aphidicola (Cinara pseudotaxifoliae)]